jgi:hypothetical protein
VAPEEGVEAGRVGVERDRQHVAAGVKDALRPIAVVQVDVEDGDPFGRIAQKLRGNRRVVEVTEAAGQVAEGVMARRSAERIGTALAGEQQPGPGDRALGAPIGGAPGLGADRAR